MVGCGGKAWLICRDQGDFPTFLHERVIVDQRPMGSAVVVEVRPECLPITIERVPPGLNSVIAGMELVDAESL